MSWTEPALAPYPYGRKIFGLYDAMGSLIAHSSDIQEHLWGSKVIPSRGAPGQEWICHTKNSSSGTGTARNQTVMAGSFRRRAEASVFRLAPEPLLRTGKGFVIPHDPR